nr:glutamine synthetase [Sporosarcina ureae]
MLKAGFGGIKHKLTPPGPVNRNIYEMKADELAVNNIGLVVTDLDHAHIALPEVSINTNVQ